MPDCRTAEAGREAGFKQKALLFPSKGICLTINQAGERPGQRAA